MNEWAIALTAVGMVAGAWLTRRAYWAGFSAGVQATANRVNAVLVEYGLEARVRVSDTTEGRRDG